MSDHNPGQIREAARAAGEGILLAGIFFGMAYLAVAGYGPDWPWWPGIAGVLVAVLGGLSLLAITVVGRRALHFEAAVTVMCAGWPLPFLAAGFELASWSTLEIAWVAVLCSANALLSYRSARAKLRDARVGTRAAGRLEPAIGYWNISKPLFVDRQKEIGKSLARFLIPLASGVGVILLSLSTRSSAFVAGFSFFLAILLVPWAATHAAATVDLIESERQLQTRISV